MPFVIDASITAAWALPDESHPLATTVIELLRTDRAHVPGIWWYEMRNLLVMSERRGRLSPLDADAALRDLDKLAIQIEPDPPDHTAVMTLARTHRLTVYDAAYLELARRLALPLATLDVQLIRAATAQAIPLLAPH